MPPDEIGVRRGGAQRSPVMGSVRPRRLDGFRRAIPVTLGVFTLALVAVLLLWDAFPRRFPARAHDVLGALPLALIGLTYLVHELSRGATRMELVKATLLALAFYFWSANQLWPDLPAATVFNDVAIALFVLDVFLVIVGWPPSRPGDGVAETRPAVDEPIP
jgi:hypothetical protein